MIKLSDNFPTTTVEDVYAPVTIDYDGDDYYRVLNQSLGAGNIVTAVGTVKCDPSTSGRCLIQSIYSNYLPIYIRVMPSDSATAPNKLYFEVHWSGAAICKVVSTVDIADGERHAFLLKYDGTAGTVSVVVDGLDVEDASYTDRVLGTGTVPTGSAEWRIGVAAWSYSDYHVGQLGYFGVCSTGDAVYENFFDENNDPLPPDEDTWTQWGGTQPVIWNEHGDYGTNKGSFDNFTINGNPSPADVELIPTGFIQYPFTIENVYTPTAMFYNGSVRQYISNQSTSGNLVTIVCRFKRDSFTGDSTETLVRGTDGTNSRGALFLYSSDFTTTGRRNKIRFVVNNGSGTIVCSLFSDIDVMDGEWHYVLAAYDGDNGTAVMYVDGIDVIDATNGEHVAPITGTLFNTTDIVIGNAVDNAQFFEFNGYMNQVGYDDTYHTDPSVFMTGQRMDDVTWTEWGGQQPLVWNEFGHFAINKGSLGNFSFSGNTQLVNQETTLTGFTATSLWNDGVTGNETLLLNFNGTDASTTFTDSTGNHTMTAAGDAQLDTAEKKFGTASLLLDGTGDYTHCTYVTGDFDWWAGDYTIDCWVYASSWTDWSYSATYNISLLVGNNDATGPTNYWSFGPVTTGALSLYYYSDSGRRIESSAGILPTNEWVHIAMQYYASTVYLFVNGSIVATGTPVGTPTSNVSQPLNIGSGNSSYLTGQVDALRITKGTARYTPPETVGFTAPTQEPSV